MARTQSLKKTFASLLTFMVVLGLVGPSGFAITVPKTYAANFTVTNTADSGAGSLRQAIIDANGSVGADDIIFDGIVGGTITLLSNLPTISDSTTINGSTAGSRITIDASAATYCLRFEAHASSSVTGLTCDGGSSAGILFTGVGTVQVGESGSNNMIITNSGDDGLQITTATSGTIKGTSIYGNTGDGFQLTNSTNIDFGDGTISGRNKSYSNGGRGINIEGSCSTIDINENFIGTEEGSSDYGNGTSGILVTTPSTDVSIQNNTIIGNASYGIVLDRSGSNTIQANKIGVDSAGLTAVANGGGISITGADADGNVIQNNTISGNDESGIYIYNGADNTEIYENTIGLNSAGTVSLPNDASMGGFAGIDVMSADGTLIGDASDPALRNIISGNNSAGIRFEDSDNNVVATNYIGVMADESTPATNGYHAIELANPVNNTVIGGTSLGSGNTILAADGLSGVEIEGGATANGNTVRRNSFVSGAYTFINLTGTANESITAPALTSASTVNASGTAGANASIDIYVDGTWNTSGTADGSGNFSIAGTFSGTTLYANQTNASGSSSEMDSEAIVVVNQAPIVSSVTHAQNTEGDGDVDVSFVIDDAENSDTVQAMIEYTINEGADWEAATISTVDEETTATFGDPDVNTLVPYQIGQLGAYILTSSGANTINFVWEAATDVAAGTDLSNVQVRIAGYDGEDAGAGVVGATDLTLDLLDPAGLSTFGYSSYTDSEVVLTWDAATDSNFNHYEIWYGSSQSDVQNRTGTATEWDDSDDALLNTASTTETTIAVNPVNQYFKLFAIDDFGNESTLADFQLTEASPESTPSGGSGWVIAVSVVQGNVVDPDTQTTLDLGTEVEEESIAGDTEVVDTETVDTEVIDTEVVDTEVSESLPSETVEENDTPRRSFYEVVYEYVAPIKVQTIRDSFPNKPVRDPKYKGDLLGSSKHFGPLDNKHKLPVRLIEIKLGNRDLEEDSDGDGLLNYEELLYGGDPDKGDTDNDGITDGQEVYLKGTSPYDYDSDNDGVADILDEEPLAYNNLEENVSSEVISNYTEESGIDTPLGVTDSDEDGLADLLELYLKTDPEKADSDDDGVTDGDEYQHEGTDPLTANDASTDLTVVNMSDNETVTSGQQFYMGSAAPEQTIGIYEVTAEGGMVPLGETESDEAGRWSLLTQVELEDGAHTIVAVEGNLENFTNVSRTFTLNVIDYVKRPEYVSLGLKNGSVIADRQPTIDLQAADDYMVVVSWRSSVYSQTLIADSADQIVYAKPAENLELGDHTVSWYAVDLEENQKSAPTQVAFTVSNAAFVQGAEPSNLWTLILGSIAVLASLTALGLYFKKGKVSRS